jgi:hypothetical protein
MTSALSATAVRSIGRTGYRLDDAWFLDQEDRRLEPPVAEALRAWEHERVQPLRMHIAHGNP